MGPARASNRESFESQVRLRMQRRPVKKAHLQPSTLLCTVGVPQTSRFRAGRTNTSRSGTERRTAAGGNLEVRQRPMAGATNGRDPSWNDEDPSSIHRSQQERRPAIGAGPTAFAIRDRMCRQLKGSATFARASWRANRQTRSVRRSTVHRAASGIRCAPCPATSSLDPRPCAASPSALR